MSVKINANGTSGEMKALVNLLQSHPSVTDFKAHAFHTRKDGDVSQTLVLELVPARNYKTRRERKVRDTFGYVYLIRTDDPTLFKIGKATDPTDRLATFRLSLPINVDYEVLLEVDNMHVVEKELHQRFASKRVPKTEFFRLNENDVEYIRGLAA